MRFYSLFKTTELNLKKKEASKIKPNFLSLHPIYIKVRTSFNDFEILIYLEARTAYPYIYLFQFNVQIDQSDH